MIRIIGLVWVFLVWFISCAPSPETNAAADQTGGQEYALTSASPVNFMNEGGRYGMLRLRVAGDSAYLFNPFTDYEVTVPAYSGERPAGVGDSIYLEYTVGDEGLIAEWREGDRRYRLFFEPVPSIAAGYWPDSLAGRTLYAVVDGDTLAVHVMDIDFANRSRRFFNAQSLRLSDGVERVPNWRDVGFAFATGSNIRAAFGLPRGRKPGEMRPPQAAAGMLADGAPVLYVLGTDTLNPVPIDSIPLRPLPSLLPETIADGELLEILNGGRLRVMELPAEPDSVGIAYQNEGEWEHDPVLTRGEVSQLDISFAAEHRFTLFAGDRIVRQGMWGFSTDRNFLEILPDQSSAQGLMLIRAYGEEYLSIPFPLEVETAGPRGVRLRSYYRPVTELRFYRQ